MGWTDETRANEGMKCDRKTAAIGGLGERAQRFPEPWLTPARLTAVKIQRSAEGGIIREERDGPESKREYGRESESRRVCRVVV